MTKSAAKKTKWTDEERENLLYFDKHWRDICPELKQSRPDRRPNGFFKCAAQYIGNKMPTNCKPALQKLLGKSLTSTPENKNSTNKSLKKRITKRLITDLPFSNSKTKAHQNWNSLSQQTKGTICGEGHYEIELNGPLPSCKEQPFSNLSSEVLFGIHDNNDNELYKTIKKPLSSGSVVLDPEISWPLLARSPVPNKKTANEDCFVPHDDSPVQNPSEKMFVQTVEKAEEFLFFCRKTYDQKAFESAEIKRIKLKLNNITKHVKFISKHMPEAPESANSPPNAPASKPVCQ